MSAEAVTVVLHHSKAEGTAKLILWGIANHHSDQGAWPSVATLAKYAAVSERRVQQVIRDLVNLGEISIEEQGGFGTSQYKTNRYFILIGCPVDCDGSLNHKTGVKSGVSGVKSENIRGEIWGTSGVKPTSPEPNKELNKNLHTSEDEFQSFWNAYPRKDGKETARRSFIKALKKTTSQNLLIQLELYKKHNIQNSIIFAHASTWLNNERWLDENASQPTADSEALRKSQERREREKRASDEYLAQLKMQEAHRGLASRCEHDKIVAMCVICSKKLNE